MKSLRRFKLGFMYGRWSTQFHGGFDFENLFGGRGLTGSESSFFNISRTLAERGHDVYVSCKTTRYIERPKIMGGAKIIEIPVEHDRPSLPADCDAYISWNEPDLLRFVPSNRLRIVDHQINDFGFCYEGFDNYVDKYVLVSYSQGKNLESVSRLNLGKAVYIPNPIDLDFFEQQLTIKRTPGSMIFSSSPDRGLHRILEILPRIRREVPEANLHVYYEWKRVYEKTRDNASINGLRFRYMKTLIDRMGENGENGLHVHGNVSNREMIAALQATKVFAYTCEPLRYTEGFSVGTMDACAAGCYPILSDADALPEIYGGVAEIVKGNPVLAQPQWISAITRALTDEEHRKKVSVRAMDFARGFSRQLIADRWEKLLQDNVR